MWNWMRSEGGQDLTEYALIIALIVIGAMAAMTFFGASIRSALNSVASALGSVLGG
jgi:Flp pilus assembly pilin Flp